MRKTVGSAALCLLLLGAVGCQSELQANRDAAAAEGDADAALTKSLAKFHTEPVTDPNRETHE